MKFYQASRQFSTSMYMWTAMPRIQAKQATNLKQQISLRKGVPTRVEAYDSLDVRKIRSGMRHSAAITGEGDLYTCGMGNWGVLGHGNEKNLNHDTPKLVEYFKQKDIKVKDVRLGEYHSLALTQDGDIYTWGYGGRKGMFNWMYSQEIGALGHGDKEPVFVPKKVQFFKENNIKVAQIASGIYHCMALTESGELYIWGRGQYGVLGNGSNAYSLLPELNEEFKVMLEENPEDNKITKIDAADEYSGALTKNGVLYTWGKNDRGQLGVGSGFGIDMVESESQPKEVAIVDANEQMIPVVDFSTGQNTMIVRAEDNSIYKTGLKLDYSPKRLDFSSEFDSANIQAIACGSKHYAIVSKDDKMLTWGSILKAKPELDIEGFGLHYTKPLFEDGKIIDISMKYGVYAAVVEHK